MLSYVLFVLLVGGGQLREASGIIGEVANGTFTDCANRTCSYGLYNDYSVSHFQGLKQIFQHMLNLQFFFSTKPRGFQM